MEVAILPESVEIGKKRSIGCTCETCNIKLNKSIKSHCFTICDVCSEKQFLSSTKNSKYKQ
jgi:hypothetical protein